MKYLFKWIAWVLVVIGALNWGLMGFFNFNLVTTLFASMPIVVTVVYDVVGVSALVLIGFKIAKVMKKPQA
jgi:uncharacterized protein